MEHKVEKLPEWKVMSDIDSVSIIDQDMIEIQKSK
jgi:hypothetical protein